MGRTEKSQGLAPPSIRKEIRAKQARNIINKVIPAVLASNARARRGADSSELFADPGPASNNDNKKSDGGDDDVAYIKRKGQGRRKAKLRSDDGDIDQQGKSKAKNGGRRRNDSTDEDFLQTKLDKAELPMSLEKKRTVRIVTTDSLTAAQTLSSSTANHNRKAPNTCILNMASPLRPGGGVLAGATSQEEFLCARTTLLPSLKESFYRLPEIGGIFTPDVLVFRSCGPLRASAADLSASERYYVDVISAGMLRFPDLEGKDDEVKTLTRKDRDIVQRKMRAVLRIAQAKGVQKLVLGAWGCGAYANPVADIATAWSRVLSDIPSSSGEKKGRAAAVETWPGLQEVIFAIPNHKMASDFALAFGSGVEVESGSQNFDEDEEEEGEDVKRSQELRTKIEELEGQISKVWNADLKLRLSAVLNGLKAQLEETQDEGGGTGFHVSELDAVVPDEQHEQHEYEENDDELDTEDSSLDCGVVI